MSTFAQVSDPGISDQQDLHTAAFPQAGCGQTVKATPDPAQVTGKCGTISQPSTCSAQATSTATGGESGTVSGSEATLNLTGHASGAGSYTGTPSSDVTIVSGGASSANVMVKFQLSTAATVTASAVVNSARSDPNDAADGDVLIDVQNGGGIWEAAATANTTFDLPAGLYTIELQSEARGVAQFGGSRPNVTGSQASSDVSVVLNLKSTGPPPCPPDSVSSVQVGLARAEGCFTERTDSDGKGTGVYETDQEAWVGGFDLVPNDGAKLVIDPKNLTAPLSADGGGVDLELSDSTSIPAPLPAIKPFTPSFSILLNAGGTLERVVALPILNGSSAQATVTWNPGGAGCKVDLQISIEDLTKNLGTAIAGVNVGTFSGQLTLQFQNNAKLDITKGKLQLPEFSEELKNTAPPIKFGFGGGSYTFQIVDGHRQWSGEASILLPFQSESGPTQGKLTGRLYFTDSEIDGFGFGLSGITEPIGETGWDLSGVEDDLIFRPDLAFNLGMSAQTHVDDPTANTPLFKLTGNLKALRLAQTDCPNGTNPFEFLGTATIPPLVAHDIGDAQLKLTMCAYVSGVATGAFEVGASGTINFGGSRVKKLITVTGSATGWFHNRGNGLLTDFNLDGRFSLQVPIFGNIAAQGVLSSEGYGVCGTYLNLTAGIASSNWVEAPQVIFPCDFTPYRVPPPSAVLGRARLAATSQAVTVPSGLSGFAIKVTSASGQPAPRVKVSGPNGESFLTPAGATALKSKGAVIVPVDQLSTTYLVLRSPAGGVWHVTPMSGSSSIKSLQSSTPLPASHVSARLSVHNGTATLVWKASAVPGQKIEFVDRAQGVATHLGTVSGTSGTIQFTIADALATHRTIEAEVVVDGIPQADRTIATYTVPAPALPRKVKGASAKRKNGSLVVTWRPLSGAIGYSIALSKGKTLLTRVETSKPTVTILKVPSGRLTVTIQAQDQFGRLGTAATVSTG